MKAANEWDFVEGQLHLERSPSKDKAAPKKQSVQKRFENLFDLQCRQNMLPKSERQYRFAKDAGRRWQFDFCFPEYQLAVEIEGLNVQQINGRSVCLSRHTSPGGFNDDCEKYANAVLFGWVLVRFTTTQVESKFAIDMTQRILFARGWRR